MFKKLVVIAAAGAFVFSLSACGKQEEQKGGAPGAAPGAPAGQQQLALPQKGQEATVTLPPDVQKAWKAIKVSVENKNTKDKKEYTIKIGSEKEIPGTKLSIKAVEFVPSFVMQGLNITSASNDPNNPAAKVVISEGGKEIFKGWLFQKFPTTHAFSHPEYAVTLVGWDKG